MIPGDAQWLPKPSLLRSKITLKKTCLRKIMNFDDFYGAEWTPEGTFLDAKGCQKKHTKKSLEHLYR